MKNKKFQELIHDMENCSKCINLKCKNKSLINKPSIILTLGYYPLMSLSKIHKFNIEKTLKETI